MPIDAFRGWYAESVADPPEWRELSAEQLPEGDVLVRVEYSDLNYKDALAMTGRGKILRRAPIVPGIDFAGTVVESRAPEFRAGDKVLATGHGLGESHSGGYAEYARVPAGFLLPIPGGFDARRAMAMGTAGVTAALCVMALERLGVKLGDGPAVVSGSTGGVGSVAVALLTAEGYEVTAVTGRPEHEHWLRELGATEVIPRERLSELKKPLERGEWAAGVDTVGGKTLAGMLASMRQHGAVAACGLAGSATLETTVFPFILRNVALLGVESVTAPRELRLEAWKRLASQVPWDRFEKVVSEVSLTQAREASGELLDGKRWGRVVVKVSPGA